MLSDRTKNTCPNATFVSIGKIKNYTLQFGNYFSSNWNGHVATIVPNRDTYVWGVVWDIDDSEIELMDVQEGVSSNHYNTIFVPVVLQPSLQKCYCYSYQVTGLPTYSDLPSKSYLSTIIKGATEHRLPENYILFLKSFVCNGKESKVKFPNV